MQIMSVDILVYLDGKGGVRGKATAKSSSKRGTPPPARIFMMAGIDHDNR